MNNTSHIIEHLEGIIDNNHVGVKAYMIKEIDYNIRVEIINFLKSDTEFEFGTIKRDVKENLWRELNHANQH